GDLHDPELPGAGHRASRRRALDAWRPLREIRQPRPGREGRVPGRGALHRLVQGSGRERIVCTPADVGAEAAFRPRSWEMRKARRMRTSKLAAVAMSVLAGGLLAACGGS